MSEDDMRGRLIEHLAPGDRQWISLDLQTATLVQAGYLAAK